MATESDEGICPLTKESIHPLGDFKLPVTTNAPFGKFKPEDLDAEGEHVAYPESNIVCDLKAGTMTSTIFGVLDFSGQGVVVKPLWTVSEDAQTLTMDIYHEDCFNDRIPLTVFVANLPEECTCADKDMMGEAAAQALTEGEPVMDVLVAKGQEPRQGKNGRIQLKLGDEKESGTEQEDGSINFRERGSGSSCVQEGEEVAILHPPSKGRPGYDVLGNTFPAEDGQAEVLKAGTGVASTTADDGRVFFTATMGGMVVVKDGTLSISEVMEVGSDVDMSTGNVRVGKGSILVKGTVTTGFEVEAAKSVHVDDVVENATIKAGDDVIVGGGILMEEGGRIDAGGNVSAKFIRNATIRAGGDVLVEVDMVNCDVIAGGKIICESDKGVLNGGSYVCSGANVAEIGTDGGSKTTVTLDLPGGEDVSEKEEALKARIEELEKYIGSDDIKNTLLLAPKEDRGILAELFKIKAGLAKQLSGIGGAKEEALKKHGEALAKLRFKVRKTAHAGSTIVIGDKSITLNRAEQASKFHWDAEKSGIAITGL